MNSLFCSFGKARTIYQTKIVNLKSSGLVVWVSLMWKWIHKFHRSFFHNVVLTW